MKYSLPYMYVTLYLHRDFGGIRENLKLMKCSITLSSAFDRGREKTRTQVPDTSAHKCTLARRSLNKIVTFIRRLRFLEVKIIFYINSANNFNTIWGFFFHWLMVLPAFKHYFTNISYPC